MLPAVESEKQSWGGVGHPAVKRLSRYVHISAATAAPPASDPFLLSPDASLFKYSRLTPQIEKNTIAGVHVLSYNPLASSSLPLQSILSVPLLPKSLR